MAYNLALERGKILLSFPVLAELNEVLGRQQYRKYVDECADSSPPWVARPSGWRSVRRSSPAAEPECCHAQPVRLAQGKLREVSLQFVAGC